MGERVTVLLGAASATAGARRAVSGVIRGSAVRSPTQLDLLLGEVISWYVEAPPAALAVAPPHVTVAVQVGLRGSVADTLALLTGRAGEDRVVVAAAEVPYLSCWRCRTPAVAGAKHCTHCGHQVASGIEWGETLAERYSGRPGTCPVCWGRRRGDGAACGSCGTRQADLDAIQAAHGTRLPFTLRRGGRRLGTGSGRVLAVHVERGGPLVARARLALSIADVRWTPAGRAEEEVLPPSLVLPLQVVVPTAGMRAVARALAEGRPVQATEAPHRCPACDARAEAARAARQPVHTPRLLDGPFCVQCGARAALAGLGRPAGGRGHGAARRRVSRHHCGGPCVLGRDPHCGTCGDAIALAPDEDVALLARLSRL